MDDSESPIKEKIDELLQFLPGLDVPGRQYVSVVSRLSCAVSKPCVKK
jgi:hypothetical protein